MIIRRADGSTCAVTVTRTLPDGWFYAYKLRCWEDLYSPEQVVDAEHGRGVDPDVDTTLRYRAEPLPVPGGGTCIYATVPLPALRELLPSLPDLRVDATPTRDLPEVVALEVGAALAR